ncbi:MAG: DUF5123 domain-containing protein [Dysgonamonadaceae bacterium]|jgi:hypothetical protein|nr:DUF5123 domain-containing protein [Dysgonamonadaceae bacterium]
MKTKNVFIWIVACIWSIGTANAAIRYVKPGGTGDGSSWAKAAGDILPATLTDGDIIFVAAGTYSITTNLAITRSNVSLYGACVGTETSVSQLAAVPDTVNNKTIIQYTGEAAGTGRVINATSPNVLIQGFRITGGNLSSGNGGGLLIASGTVRYCTISGNKAPNGGGIRLNGSDANSAIENCIISGNEATVAGGGINLSKNTQVNNCIIQANKASTGAGGIYTTGGGGEEIDRCIIDGNETAGGDGGGVVLNKALLTNSLVSNNKGGGTNRGGGIRISSGSNVSFVYNCTVVNNESGSGGGGGISSQNGISFIKNCIAWNNRRNTSGTITDDNLSTVKAISSYSICTDAADNNNLNADPLFTDAAHDDYTLQESSPARGAGDPSVGLTVDLAGNPRGTATIDIGAYEYYTQETGLTPIAAGKTLLRYLSATREIVVDNPAGTSITVYNPAGVCIVKKEAATRISTAGWAKGVYIVKAETVAVKIAVN